MMCVFVCVLVSFINCSLFVFLIKVDLFSETVGLKQNMKNTFYLGYIKKRKHTPHNITQIFKPEP